MSPVSEDAREKPFAQDDQAHRGRSDGVEEFVDEGDTDVESPEDVASLPAPSKAGKLKQRLRRLRAVKSEHDLAGEELSRDIQAVERLLLDAVCNEG